MTAPWIETRLPTILSNYSPRDVFNANKFVQFHRALPETPLHLQGKTCSAGKHSRIPITGLAAANMAGGKHPMLVIGKSKKPRFLKLTLSLPWTKQKVNDVRAF